MYLSFRAKEAIKTALAMTISYAIALSMDWDKPMWAGFAVAFISLDTIGQSLNKGAMRMLGTLVATVAALTILSLFAQDRWLFMCALSLYVAFCTYKMGGSKYSYFWFACGFVCVIIALEAGPDSENTFLTALHRAETTGLGILIYSLVSVFLWPNNTRSDFEESVKQLNETQYQVYRTCYELMNGAGNPDTINTLKKQVIHQQNQFEKLLNAAITDSYEIWEMRRQWRLYRDLTLELSETMERLRESFAEIQELDLHSLLPGLTSLHTELSLRMKQIGRMLTGVDPDQKPAPIALRFDRKSVHQLSHFQKAAFAVTRSRLQHMERLTRSLFDTISDINGFGQPAMFFPTSNKPAFQFTFDPDRLASALRVIANIWLAFLAMVYINEIPGGVGFIILTGVVGMTMATKPQMSVLLLFSPVAYSLLFAGILYIFIMPGLSSFAGLGLMIFIVTFAICYLFSAPRQALGRSFGLALFAMIASITNEQSYHFLSFANSSLMFPMGFVVLAATAYFPISTRSEKVFQHQLKRYFKSCEFLTSTLRWESESGSGWLYRFKQAFHHRELSTLPLKMMSWIPHIDTRYLPGTKPQNLQDLVITLQSLSLWMQELLEARSNPQAQFLVKELLADVREWRLKVQKTFQQLSFDPAIGEFSVFRTRLDEIINHLEDRIETTMDKAPEGELSDEESESFYRLLGAYRGVSEALVNFAHSAGDINWERMHEERFA